VFCGWLFDVERIPSNTLARMSALDVELDRKRVRRALTTEEAVKLIETTAAQSRIGGMTGIDRMVRYALGIGTGLRQATLFSLRPEDFHLDEEEFQFIRVLPTTTKNRKPKDQLVRDDLAALLRPWLAGKPKGRPVFTKSPAAKPIIAYRSDLKAAGITYNEEGTNLYCDQHAQRNAYITAVIRAAGLKVAQDLAGHSTPNLTSKYGRLEMSDYAKGLTALPPVKAKSTDAPKKTKAG
jgi:integrase